MTSDLDLEQKLCPLVKKQAHTTFEKQWSILAEGGGRTKFECSNIFRESGEENTP